eukprot:gene15569-biopygen13099
MSPFHGDVHRITSTARFHMPLRYEIPHTASFRGVWSQIPLHPTCCFMPVCYPRINPVWDPGSIKELMKSGAGHRRCTWQRLLAPVAGAGTSGSWRWEQALRRNTCFGAGRRRCCSRTLALAIGSALSANDRRWVGAVPLGAGLAPARRFGAGLALAD